MTLTRNLSALMACLMLYGCHGTAGTAHDADAIPKGARVLHFEYAGGRNVRTLALRGGIACQADGTLGPLTYSAADTARVRRLTKREASTLMQIRRFVHSPDLRFTWVGGRFIVYDATYGVCNGGLYWVMNGGCNEFYSSTDTWMDHTVPGSPDWSCTPPPWER